MRKSEPVVSTTKNHPSNSDHFDGKRFFNPEHPQVQTLWDGLKLFSSSKSAKWPERVANHPKFKLDHDLSQDDVAVTFVNHATLLIQAQGYNILTDPVWSERVSPFRFIGPKRVRKPGISLGELPKIDLILVSHNHYDHMDIDTLKILIQRDQPHIFVPIGDKKRIEKLGAKLVISMDWWDETHLDTKLKIIFTPTQHFSSRGLFDRNKSLWGSFVIQLLDKKIYFGGDAGYSNFYQQIYQRLGHMDLAFLPIGAYEPRWFMKSVHMNPADAVQAHLDLHSKQSIAIHFNTFQLTAEAIDQPEKDLMQALMQQQIDAASFLVIKEGQTQHFSLNHSN